MYEPARSGFTFDSYASFIAEPGLLDSVGSHATTPFRSGLKQRAVIVNSRSAATDRARATCCADSHLADFSKLGAYRRAVIDFKQQKEWLTLSVGARDCIIGPNDTRCVASSGRLREIGLGIWSMRLDPDTVDTPEHSPTARTEAFASVLLARVLSAD